MWLSRSGRQRRGPSPPIPNVRHGEQRMDKQHPRPRIAHDGADLLAHVCVVAVHHTLRARWLGIAEHAAIQASRRVREQRFAILAEAMRTPVPVATINVDHRADRLELAGKSRVSPRVVDASRRRNLGWPRDGGCSHQMATVPQSYAAGHDARQASAGTLGSFADRLAAERGRTRRAQGFKRAPATQRPVVKPTASKPA